MEMGWKWERNGRKMGEKWDGNGREMGVWEFVPRNYFLVPVSLYCWKALFSVFLYTILGYVRTYPYILLSA